MSSQTPPPTMRAWIFSSRGPPRKVLTLAPSHPTSSAPTGSNVLIRISHAALNPAGPVLMTLFPSFVRPKFSIPDLDFSGTVLQCGPSAPSKYKPGTRMFGSLIPAKAVLSGKGVLAEYIVVDEEMAPMGVVPDGMEMSDAAGLGSCGQTAVFLCRRAGVKEGDRVLVNGASGGVGTMAVQVARAMGASFVVGICSGRNEEFVKGVGADEVVDYQAHQPVHEYLARKYGEQQFDVILDTVGSQGLYENSPGYLKTQGIFVNVGSMEGLLWAIWCWFKNTWRPSFLGGVPRKYCMFSTVFNQETADLIAKYAVEGKLKAAVSETLEMQDALMGYDIIMSKRAKRKVVVKVQTVSEIRGT